MRTGSESADMGDKEHDDEIPTVTYRPHPPQFRALAQHPHFQYAVLPLCPSVSLHDVGSAVLLIEFSQPSYERELCNVVRHAAMIGFRHIVVDATSRPGFLDSLEIGQLLLCSKEMVAIGGTIVLAGGAAVLHTMTHFAPEWCRPETAANVSRAVRMLRETVRAVQKSTGASVRSGERLTGVTCRNGTLSVTAASRPKRDILWIDDSHLLLDQVVPMLTALGFRVTTVSDNDEALTTLRERRREVDLVIEDGMRPPGMCMARLDVELACVALEFHSRFVRRYLPHVPTVFFTLRADTPFLEAVSELDGCHYVRKGSPSVEIVSVVRSLTGATETLYEDRLTQDQFGVAQVSVSEVNEGLIALLAKHPQGLYELNPRTFEELVAMLFEDQGYRVSVTPRTRDGGRDILAVSCGGFVDVLYFIECKRYDRNRPVGVEIVRSVYGVKAAERANAAIVVTTSFFTEPARAFQRKVGFELSLRDYEDLKGWLSSYRGHR